MDVMIVLWRFTDGAGIMPIETAFLFIIEGTTKKVLQVIMPLEHRLLSNIDCLTACTACLVCFICTVNRHSKKKPWKTSAGSGNITNLKQSSLETFDIYALESIYNKNFCFNEQKCIFFNTAGR